jgi:hypothetical protein
VRVTNGCTWLLLCSPRFLKLKLSHRRAEVKHVWGLCFAAAALAASGAHAQAVYKCGARSYSQAPCSTRVVRTYDAPVPTSPKPQVIAVRRLPGETDDEFNTRKRRAALSESDRDECARLDKRMPVELARLKKPQEDEIDDAQAALTEIKKRAAQLHC